MARLERSAAALLLAFALAGCTALPLIEAPGAIEQDIANPQLAFLLQIYASNSTEREALWKSVRSAPRGGSSTELRTALLQSVEGHSGYDSAAAEARLRVLLQKKPDSDIRSVARLRLLQLKGERQCAASYQVTAQELADVKAQLAKLVEIERLLDRKNLPATP